MRTHGIQNVYTKSIVHSSTNKMRYRTIELVFYEQSAPTHREGRDQKQARAERLQESLRPRCGRSISYALRYGRLPFSGQSRGDGLLCKAC